MLHHHFIGASWCILILVVLSCDLKPWLRYTIVLRFPNRVFAWEKHGETLSLVLSSQISDIKILPNPQTHKKEMKQPDASRLTETIELDRKQLGCLGLLSALVMLLEGCWHSSALQKEAHCKWRDWTLLSSSCRTRFLFDVWCWFMIRMNLLHAWPYFLLYMLYTSVLNTLISVLCKSSRRVIRDMLYTFFLFLINNMDVEVAFLNTNLRLNTLHYHLERSWSLTRRFMDSSNHPECEALPWMTIWL